MENCDSDFSEEEIIEKKNSFEDKPTAELKDILKNVFEIMLKEGEKLEKGEESYNYYCEVSGCSHSKSRTITFDFKNQRAETDMCITYQKGHLWIGNLMVRKREEVIALLNFFQTKKIEGSV